MRKSALLLSVSLSLLPWVGGGFGCAEGGNAGTVELPEASVEANETVPAPAPTRDASRGEGGRTRDAANDVADEPTGDAGVDPKRACADMAHEVAQTGQRECGFPYASGYQEFMDQYANGSCSSVRALRDADELYRLCIPFLRSQNCTDWTAGTSDPSCDNQLILQ
jgi:hypothetical protein